MRHGAHRVARNMATTALQQAEWLGDAAAATQAQQLGRRAVQAEAHSRSRDRRDRRLRLALHTGGPVLTVILALGVGVARIDRGTNPFARSRARFIPRFIPQFNPQFNPQ